MKTSINTIILNRTCLKKHFKVFLIIKIAFLALLRSFLILWKKLYKRHQGVEFMGLS